MKKSLDSLLADHIYKKSMSNSPNKWQDLLRRWISGDANLNDERSLEGMAADDPFLADALEGYRQLPEATHARSLTSLKKQLRERSQSGEQSRGGLLLRIAAVGVCLLAAWFVIQQMDALQAPIAESTQHQPAAKKENRVVQGLKSQLANDSMQAEADEAVAGIETEQTAPTTFYNNRQLTDPPKRVQRYNDLDTVASEGPIAQLAPTPATETKRYRTGNEQKDAIEPSSFPDFQKTSTVTTNSNLAVEVSAPEQNAEFSADEYVQIDSILVEDKVLAFDEQMAGKADEQGELLTIKGKVTDSSGEPLIGASVLVNTTNFATVTDLQGFFSVQSPLVDPALTVSYTGYESQELQLKDEDFVNIALSEGVALDEVSIQALSSKARAKKEASPVAQIAEPKGGFRKFERYILQNLKMPQAAIDAGINGTVMLGFRLDANGRPIAFEVFRSLGYGCEEEAIRLLEEGPKWKGATDTLHSYTFEFK